MDYINACLKVTIIVVLLMILYGIKDIKYTIMENIPPNVTEVKQYHFPEAYIVDIYPSTLMMGDKDVKDRRALND